jgi:hypothetical protein
MPDLKNIRQIGSPTDTDKIYMENRAYQRIHREELAERRVFVLMGHTECAPGGYTTFVEDVIPVWEIAFAHGVPVWNNHVWNVVFGEVKRSFENSVIIGWALDIKGIPPRLTPELEAVHREHFGGAHQLLFLLDSLEQEEYFYQNRSGFFYPKDGFYIYFEPEAAALVPESVRSENAPEAAGWRTIPRGETEEGLMQQGAQNRGEPGGTVQQALCGGEADEAAQKEMAHRGSAHDVADQGKLRRMRLYEHAGKTAVNREIQERRRIRENRVSREIRKPSDDLIIIECEENGSAPKARYRELMYGTDREQRSDSGKWLSSAAVVVAMLLLLAIIGTGIRQGRFSLEGIEQAVESISTKVLPQTEESAKEAAESAETGTDTQDVSAMLKAMEQNGEDAGILVEEVPQGDIISD